MAESLADRLTNDLKDAMRAKDKVRLRTIRQLRSALKNKAIDAGEDLSDQEALAVVRKEAKQRKEAIAQYEEAGRSDLVAKEQEELDVLQDYLPAPMTEEELRGHVQEVIDAVGASSMADMGPVMGRAMSDLKGRVDGGRVQQVAKELLS
ncbi:GatB/YqeY domain-containing protein [Salisaeta longa]|uniref:GatB/YqeY domain-containing protein n=1 Tax=Salisaeta longa TaxID=503170 RepID=UPI0003B7B2EC|nr:GatB/YqeY domain-containing protein [Salisaeta longa]